jgi:7-keto-8-aminopelargonate synthetase-like enzyme
MPPAVAAASVAAIELVRGAEGTQRRAALAANVERFAAGRPRSVRTPIHPVRVGDDRRVMEISEALLAEGVYVQGIRPPTVPVGTARLRIALSADHQPGELETLNNALRRFT